MKIQPVDLRAQYQAYQAEIDAAIQQVLTRCDYIGGADITALENELAAFCGAQYAICCSSGTDALLLALMAADIRPGDEIITPSFTFVATAETIALLGARPVFTDIDRSTALMDVTKIEAAITAKTKAIIPVSLFGQTCAMDAINEIAAKHNLVVIEDAAQSFGARYKDKCSCNLSTYACTSFYPAKPLGCYGDGGAVFTHDEEAMRKIRRLLNHGQSDRYTYTEIGINGRLDTLQAAILRVKLRHYAQELQKRRTLAALYTEAITATSFTPVRILPQNTSTFAQFCIYTEPTRRADLIQGLARAGVPTAIYYPKPLHVQAAYQDLARYDDLRQTELAAASILSIPLHPFMTDAECRRIVSALQELS